MQAYRQAVSYLAPRLQAVLLMLSFSDQARVREIRLRKERPLCLTLDDGTHFLRADGKLHTDPLGAVICSERDLKETLQRASGYSIHSHEQQMAEGFLTLNGGHRMGLCGTAVYQNDVFYGVRSISSLNLRIARTHVGSAAMIVDRFYRGETLPSLLICGEPLSGKTTVLRDIVYQLAGGHAGKYHKIAVVDERSELAGSCEGVLYSDLGACADVLDGYPKGKGMNIALRTLSPELIVCDEIGEREESDAILQSVHTGVPILTSAHACSYQELLRRPQIRRLIEEQVFDGYVFLAGKAAPGKIKTIRTVGENDAQV